MERKLLQIALALVSLTGELIVAPLLWAGRRHVVRVSQCGAVT